MKRWVLFSILTILFMPCSGWAQVFLSRDYFREVWGRSRADMQLPAADGLQGHVVDGKLRLSLKDAVYLVLKNNTELNIQRADYQISAFQVPRAYQSFEPIFTSSFAPTRNTSPSISQLEGASTVSDLTQVFSSEFSHKLPFGTQYSVSLDTTRSATNSAFNLFNPSLFSSLGFQITQPLLRNRGAKMAQAPIRIARSNVEASYNGLLADVNQAVLGAINQYWQVVQAQENLKVLQASLDAAEATYKHDKRALELGALPPLDIYRSESEVAQRKLAVIQAQFDLKQLEDSFRRTIGADLDPQVSGLELDLTEDATAVTQAAAPAPEEALQSALQNRPELLAFRNQIEANTYSIEVAQNSLKPDLSLTGFYRSNGRGGNQVDASTTPATLLSSGGLLDSFDQLAGFNFPTYGFNLQLTLPLRNRAAEADFGAALASERRALYQERQQEQAVREEVRSALYQMEKQALSVEAAKQARDLAEKNSQAEQRKYELGAQTIFFVLEAQTELQQAEVNLVQAQIGYQRAVASLHRAMGTLLNEYNIQLVDIIGKS